MAAGEALRMMPLPPAPPGRDPGVPMRSFGRIKGRPLRARQADLVARYLPLLAVPLDGAGKIDLPCLFPAGRDFALEIGFGGGEHLIGQALARPDRGFLGAEPFHNGVAKCVAGLAEAGLLAEPGNLHVRLHAGDARPLLPRLADGAFAQVYLLFPDPWPKARHRKRRILQPEFAAEIARILAPGGEFRMATDWLDYADEALAILAATPGLVNADDGTGLRSRPPADHVTTRYETRGLGDTVPIWLRFRRDGDREGARD